VEIRVRLPRIPPGLGVNLLGVAGLVAIVCAVAALTSWKWGLLAAGVFAVGLTVVAQYQETLAVRAPAGGNVKPLAEVRQSRISATAEAQLAAEAARTTAELPRVNAAR
jgi:hypothetical protein